MDEQLEALQTADGYIGNLENGIKKLVGYLQEGREQRGCEMIPLVAEGIEWLMQVIRLTEKFHKGNISNEDIDEKLNEIVEALENEDYILMSDLFNYEILPILNNIHNQIANVINVN